MLSKIPIDINNLEGENLDSQILRAAIIAELDAVNLYEQMALKTMDNDLQEVLLDIAKEEKTHIGEFQALLLKKDKEQQQELKNGKKEVQEIKK